jgi:hypothetical protein
MNFMYLKPKSPSLLVWLLVEYTGPSCKETSFVSKTSYIIRNGSDHALGRIECISRAYDGMEHGWVGRCIMMWEEGQVTCAWIRCLVGV